MALKKVPKNQNVKQVGVENTEKEILALLLKRDLAGMDMLYDKYSKYIFGLIREVVKKEDVSELVLQDTFLKVWDKIDTFSAEKGRLLTWIMNIARNTAIDMTRSKHYKQTLRLISLDNATPDEIPASSVKMEHMDLKDIVGKLDKKYRDLIQLVYFKGYTHVEVSEELGIPLGTVKSRIRKAFSELRGILEG